MAVVVLGRELGGAYEAENNREREGFGAVAHPGVAHEVGDEWEVVEAANLGVKGDGEVGRGQRLRALLV